MLGLHLPQSLQHLPQHQQHQQHQQQQHQHQQHQHQQQQHQQHQQHQPAQLDRFNNQDWARSLAPVHHSNSRPVQGDVWRQSHSTSANHPARPVLSSIDDAADSQSAVKLWLESSVTLPPLGASTAHGNGSAAMSSSHIAASHHQDVNRPDYYSNTHFVPGYSLHQPVLSQPGSRAPSRAPSPQFHSGQEPVAQGKSVGSGSNSIVPYLQLPSTITSSKGSLAEFAAQITCLFWFESSQTLSLIEDSKTPPFPTNTLALEAIPTTGFLKWVTTILSTTQVTQNVILLALLFVYRLKTQNPSVKGKPGSEFRLLTVALMLGNKFLDDNTYTNKTWAEVSGISVQEIHVMEVEFLSHMKYNLYTSKDEWEKWHQQLSKFYTYFERASRKLHEPRTNNFKPVLQVPYALPSPPASTATSPPYHGTHIQNMAVYSNPTPQQVTPLSISPVGSTPDFDPSPNSRKRSYDHVLEEPLAKRSRAYSPYHTSAPVKPYGTTMQSQQPVQSQSQSILPPPIPKLHIPTSQPGRAAVPASYHNYAVGDRVSPTASLPPLNWIHGLQPSTHSTPLTATGPLTPSRSKEQARRQLPYEAHSHHASPTASHFPSIAAHTANLNQQSPSHFLTQRSSPYRPVRNMNTLLHPPPSGSLHDPSAHVSQDQMHWQPLAKQTIEPRTGRVPYLHREAWPQTYQVDQWPSASYALPQPWV